MTKLSDTELAVYRRDGYVVPAFRLATDKVDRLRATLDKLIADNPDVRPEKLVSAHVDGDVETPSLVMEDGAVLNGKLNMAAATPKKPRGDLKAVDGGVLLDKPIKL